VGLHILGIPLRQPRACITPVTLDLVRPPPPPPPPPPTITGQYSDPK
jgi:hypothetical protein